MPRHLVLHRVYTKIIRSTVEVGPTRWTKRCAYEKQLGLGYRIWDLEMGIEGLGFRIEV